MATSNSSSSNSGIGLTGILTIVFIILKLTGYIDWSWLWVLSPLWISFLLAVAVVLFLLDIWAALEIFERSDAKRQKLAKHKEAK